MLVPIIPRLEIASGEDELGQLGTVGTKVRNEERSAVIWERCISLTQCPQSGVLWGCEIWGVVGAVGRRGTHPVPLQYKYMSTTCTLVPTER
jgi:hypothetical protein